MRIPRERVRVDGALAVLEEGGNLRAGEGVGRGATEGVAVCSLLLECPGVTAVRVGFKHLQGLMVLLQKRRGKREGGRKE